jgi:hypothetical protein
VGTNLSGTIADQQGGLGTLNFAIGVEIAGAAETNLSGWSIAADNGSNGTVNPASGPAAGTSSDNVGIS